MQAVDVCLHSAYCRRPFANEGLLLAEDAANCRMSFEELEVRFLGVGGIEAAAVSQLEVAEVDVD